jgi:Putative zinc-finger
MSDRCADARRELGAYVLAAIEPADRARVERHLDACQRCRAELASLAGLPALLRRVPDPETILAPARSWEEDTRVLPAALLSRTATIRRRHRVLAAAAAAVMVAGTAAAVSAVSRISAQPQTQTARVWQATVQAASPATGAWASIRYASRPWGTQIEAQIAGVRPGTRCQLWVTDPGGHRVAAGGWVIASGRPGSWYPGSSPLSATTLLSFEITSPDKVLVTIPARQRQGSAQRR